MLGRDPCWTEFIWVVALSEVKLVLMLVVFFFSGFIIHASNEADKAWKPLYALSVGHCGGSSVS